MTGDPIVPQLRRLLHQLLCQRTNQLVGAPTNTEEEPTLRFAVTQLPLPDGSIIVTLDDACDLADVHDLCARIAGACLNDDKCVAFSRALPGATRQARFRHPSPSSGQGGIPR